jgi:hypothetical protein
MFQEVFATEQLHDNKRWTLALWLGIVAVFFINVRHQIGLGSQIHDFACRRRDIHR